MLSGFGNRGDPVAFLTGTTTAFDAATLAALYADRDDYLGPLRRRDRRHGRAGFFLAADAEEIKAVAAVNAPF